MSTIDSYRRTSCLSVSARARTAVLVGVYAAYPGRATKAAVELVNTKCLEPFPSGLEIHFRIMARASSADVK